MARGIIIFGGSGAGKTTLGRVVAQKLNCPLIDTDDYYWRKDTEIPFTVMFPRAERIAKLTEAVEKTELFVISGTMDSFHELFDPMFDLGVHLVTDADVRVQRADAREYGWFGDRIREGGDMHEEHKEFLHQVAAYDLGGGNTSLEFHKQWAESMPCPVITLNGVDALEKNADIIVKAYHEAIQSKA